jgi:hypothetical protein
MVSGVGVDAEATGFVCSATRARQHERRRAIARGESHGYHLWKRVQKVAPKEVLIANYFVET